MRVGEYGGRFMSTIESAAVELAAAQKDAWWVCWHQYEKYGSLDHSQVCRLVEVAGAMRAFAPFAPDWFRERVDQFVWPNTLEIIQL